MHRTRHVIVVMIAAVAAACASAPPVPPAAPTLNRDQKMATILRLEDQRILRAAAPVVPPPPVSATKKNSRRAAPVPAPVVAPDLTPMLTDADARIRARAALAIGRVGLAEGRVPLQALLSDTEPGVRQAAVFALGLLADKASVPALTTALQDPEPRVRGRAAEALGLIGDTTSAAAVGQMVHGYIAAGAIAALAPDQDAWPQTPEADAVRLGLFALVRQKSYDALAAAIVDPSGRTPEWWPVAFALQRVNDPRAVPALRELARSRGRYTRAFAARGLGVAKDAASVPVLREMLDGAKGDVILIVSAVRALAQIGGTDAGTSILPLLTGPKVDPNVRLEALTALTTLKRADALPMAQDLMTDDWPTMRAAAVRAVAALAPQDFLLVLSGMEPDPHWVVRAAQADVMATLPPEAVTDRLRAMLADQDARVIPSVLEALTRLRAPGIGEVLLAQLKAPDMMVRAAAARAIGQLRLPEGPGPLRDAYAAAAADAGYDARGAVLAALARYGPAEAKATVQTALTDKDWAIRLQAAALLKTIDPSTDVAAAIRPAPEAPIAAYDAAALIAPPYSPHAFIDTAKGTIEIELLVLDAPQTTQNFIALARKGYFNGLQIHRVVPNFVVQDGDPRGDGSGGPGYTIRDELNDRPFIRGTVGMALAGPDTGGSQFFIMHSPAPHLDAKYTAFGEVVNGMDVVDRLQQLDVIQRVRIWDGKELK